MQHLHGPEAGAIHLRFSEEIPIIVEDSSLTGIGFTSQLRPLMVSQKNNLLDA